jgi:UDP-N-acetylglucosamine--N-acetylmuramyl-(pentapeptide) pyrophosphoryl-undecaprenol N-acetylglucosamine transferase
VKQLFVGTLQARKIIKEYKPDIVIGTGGYVSGPVVLNAAMMKIPTLIHEQNVFPGITIKILSRFADVVAISFNESRKYLKAGNKLVHTGNPIRQEIIDANRSVARKHLGLNEKPFILAFGGSLGADKINRTLIEYIGYIYKENKVQLMIGTGERQYQYVMDELKKQGIRLDLHKNIKVLPYIYNMNEAMAAADLVICRAGAITLSEITAIGKPAILIPSPNVTNNHQEYNARALEKQGAAIVLSESDLNGKILYNKIEDLLTNQSVLQQMEKNSLHMGITNATEKIYNIVIKLLKMKSKKVNRK